MCAGADRQLSLRERFPHALRLRAKEHVLETLLVQVPQVARTVVIMAIARQRAVAIDCDVVFGKAGKRAAIKHLAAQFRAPLVFPSENPTGEITENPIYSAALRHGMRCSDII